MFNHIFVFRDSFNFCICPHNYNYFVINHFIILLNFKELMLRFHMGLVLDVMLFMSHQLF